MGPLFAQSRIRNLYPKLICLKIKLFWPIKKMKLLLTDWTQQQSLRDDLNTPPEPTMKFHSYKLSSLLRPMNEEICRQVLIYSFMNQIQIQLRQQILILWLGFLLHLLDGLENSTSQLQTLTILMQALHVLSSNLLNGHFSSTLLEAQDSTYKFSINSGVGQIIVQLLIPF